MVFNVFFLFQPEIVYANASAIRKNAEEKQKNLGREKVSVTFCCLNVLLCFCPL